MLYERLKFSWQDNSDLAQMTHFQKHFAFLRASQLDCDACQVCAVSWTLAN